MHLIELSEADYNKRLSTPFNPPAPSVPEDEFEKEYFTLYDKIEATLSEFGKNDAYGQADYYLEPAITRSRGLGIEICQRKMITESLLQRLQHLLTSVAPDWEICLRSDNFDYGIFVSADAIRYHRNHDKISLPFIP